MASQTTKLSISPREPEGSRATRRLRRSGRVPGILYGGDAEPLTFSADARELRHALGVPVGLPATRWMLELGSFAIRTETELVLKSRWVVPERLLDAGFVHRHTDLGETLRAILRRG